MFWTCILWAQIFSKTKINLRVEFDSGVGPTCFIWICAKSLGIKKCQRKYQGYFKGQHFFGLILFAKKILNKIICEKKKFEPKNPLNHKSWLLIFKSKISLLFKIHLDWHRSFWHIFLDWKKNNLASLFISATTHKFFD